METSSFDEQIFSEFAGPLSPIGAKQINPSGHSIHVMLGMNGANSAELCNQRLPEVQSLLPGSPKLNQYKTLDYMTNKMDYNGKLTPYSSTPSPSQQQGAAHQPPPKYDYLNGKMDQYTQQQITKMDYGKPMDYNSNANKIDYESHMQMYPQQQSLSAPPPQQQPTMQTLDSPPSIGDKKKADDALNSSTPTTTSDATSTSKKNEKKKGDINGIKKKKTR